LRKLSLVVLLNDPSEFEGGDLEIKGWGRQVLQQGRAIVFPSYFWHQVHPVTAGVRIAVVAWCLGPTFR
jgi:PKHD-type hydroxylase